jgi:cysteinyl-tRNA synthetase
MVRLTGFLLQSILVIESSLAWVASRTKCRRPHGAGFYLTSLQLSAPNDSSNLLQPKALNLYNSKTRQKEPLAIQNPDQVTMYTCGPTVYDYAHVGNFRAFLTYDLLKRALLYLGYKTVLHVLNLTDVDDKIINRANQLQLGSTLELTRKYEALFLQDLNRLNILPATIYPRATEHVEQMMDLILSLRDKNLAYETSDGSWYFDSQKMPNYGQQLVQLDFSAPDAESTEGDGDSFASDKQHIADFCLWKAFKEGVDRMDAAWQREGEIKLGRPGWHLECSAMALHYFEGKTIDLHGGGQDLKFPHHENEIAQAEGATGNVFCNCWFHNGFVNMDAEKMSKSLGNFLTLQTACPTSLDVRAYRYLVMSSQYRNPLAFTPQAMEASKNAIKRIDKTKSRIEEALASAATTDISDSTKSEIAIQIVPSALANFEAAVTDDLSMPRAAAQLFSIVKEAENEFKRVAKADSSHPLDIIGLEAILNAMKQMDQLFGIFYSSADDSESVDGEAENDSVPSEVMELISQRTFAKDSKDWELADLLRARIKELGYDVKDNKGAAPTISRLDSH